MKRLRAVAAPGRRPDWGAVLIVVAGACLAGYLLGYGVGWAGEGQRVWVTDFVYLPISATAAALGWRAARCAPLPPRARRAWHLIAGAFTLQFAANAAWFWLEAIRNVSPYPSVADAGFLAMNLFLLAGLLTFPLDRGHGSGRFKLLLDALIVVASGFIVLWYLVLGPTITAGGATPVEAVVSIAYPVGDLVLLFGITTVLMRGVDAASRRALGILTGGLVLFVVADVWYGYVALHGDFAGGTWLDVLWLVANYLTALSGYVQYRGARRQGRALGRRLAGRPLPALPYVAVALAYVFLLFVARREAWYPLGGMILGSVGVTSMVVVRQMAALRENRRLAQTDGLTGLANRSVLHERLSAALDRSRSTGGGVAVLMIDLDRFKPVNDTLGHEAGDAVLVAVAHALRSVVRPSDTAARVGGDEFAVVLANPPGAPAAVAAVAAVAERVASAVNVPVVFDGHVLEVGASIGVAESDPSMSPDVLLQRADLAMYAAKKAGAGRWVRYRPELDDTLRQSELRAAVEREEFVVHYQPIIDLATGRPQGVEALVRWRHPAHGLLAPGEFIGLAAETGLIGPLGGLVLREACAQVVRWDRDLPAARALTLNVNLSPRQIRHPSLVGDVATVLGETGLDPHRLVLELTESVLMHDDSVTINKIHALRDLGVRVAVDDFGTGYSSLGYLRRLPIDALKIDRSFISAMVADEDGRTIADAVVRLGHALGLSVVAEGIETAEQLAALRRMDCESGQGFHFARPMAAEEVGTMIEAMAGGAAGPSAPAGQPHTSVHG